jgi:8-oxo-dGTP pyrophosphatase MutT (NUDIX family)
MSNNNRTLIDTGTWVWGDESVQWELHSSATIPELDKCTAAFCVAITQDKILLEREERGWGMLGGHIDVGESIEQALERECLEEGGFTIKDPILFGYRKIIATKPVNHPNPAMAYPFPISYIAYYYATNDKALSKPTEQEVLEVKSFTIGKIRSLDISDLSTITLGWDTYQKREDQFNKA